MKKRMITIAFTMIMMMLLSGSTAYAKKCKKCKEDLENNKRRYYNMGIACRDFTEPVVRKNGKSYATYRCQYGHSYLDEL